VCFACFCVYDLLERAKKLSFTNNSISVFRKTPVAHKDAESVVDRGISERIFTPEARAVARAQEAISCLTTLDVAELRSYASPPPAVSLVTTAMFVLLSGGKTLSWIETRHAMANGETFLSTNSVH